MRVRCEDCEQKVPDHFCKLSQVCNICGNEDPPGFSFVDRKRFCDGDHFLMALQEKKDREQGEGDGEPQDGEPEDGEPQEGDSEEGSEGDSEGQEDGDGTEGGNGDGEGSEGQQEGSEGDDDGSGGGDDSHGGTHGEAYEDSLEREGQMPNSIRESRAPLKATAKFDYSTLRDVVRNKQKEVKR